MTNDASFVCGISKRCITPKREWLGHVHGLMGILFSDILDDLYVRVLYLKNRTDQVWIIGFDLDKAPYPAEWVAELAEKTGVPQEHIFYFGTHTHTAPTHSIRPRERKLDLPQDVIEGTRLYEAFLHDMLFEAVSEAADEASLFPAKIGWGQGRSFINVNRNAEYIYENEPRDNRVIAQGIRDQEEVDRSVNVMEIRNLQDKPKAFLVNYAVHCCTMFLNRCNENGDMAVSGDIAGVVSRSLEEKFPGCVAVWSSGAAGDVNPIIGNELFMADPIDGSRKYETIRDSRSAYQIMYALACRHVADIHRIIETIQVFEEDPVLSGAVGRAESPALEIGMDDNGNPVDKGESGRTLKIRLQLVRIGSHELLGIGGELYNSYGRALKKKHPNLIVTNHVMSLVDDAGYILDDDAMARARTKMCVKGFFPGAPFAGKIGEVSRSIEKEVEILYETV